ncbi:hypothetical protein MMC25_000609 [Agyrium rufum]|nr:hypothetical protein [Agyrium rufum]
MASSSSSSSSSNQQQVAKRNHEQALMPPPALPVKHIKRPAKVLDEDTYTDALSHIIARDFFPGLLETETQQEYLSALESKDSEWIAAAGRKLTEVMTPGPDGRRLRGRRGTSMTPRVNMADSTPRGYRGETPMSVVSDAPSMMTTSSTQTERPQVDTNMSLGAFQTKYTSEDNESFYKLLDKQNTKKSEKYSWLWSNNKIPASRQIAYRNRETKLLSERNAQEMEDSGTQLILAEAPDKRQAMPDTWKSKPNNSLMFAPDSVEDSLQTVQQRAEEESRAAPKAVLYDNTRMPVPTTNPHVHDGSIPPSPSLSAIQEAIAGRPRPSASETASPGSETPRVNGYAFVDSEPTPAPSQLSSAWDTDANSSLLLGSGSSTPNPFQLKESSQREALHHRMVDRVAKQKRRIKLDGGADYEKGTGRTPVPKFTNFSTPITARAGMGAGGLTPAGQKLIGRIGGTRPKVGPGILGSGVGGSSGGAGTGNIWERKATPKIGNSRLRAGLTPLTKDV